VKSITLHVILVLLLVLLLFAGACLPAAGSAAAKQNLVISSLEAEYPMLYPLQHTKINCVASGAGDGEIEYTWACSSGSLSGEGATVTWTAPAEYGDYHVMVVVKDSRGNSTDGTVTVSVVVKPPEACCHGKR